MVATISQFCQRTCVVTFCSNTTMWLIADTKKELTCVTFDNGWDHVQGTNGIWVKNVGVQVVSGDCVLNNCGYFDGHSFLSIPFFKNNYHKNGFTVSFFFKSSSESKMMTLAMISNGCSDSDYASTNADMSLSISHFNSEVDTEVMQEELKWAGLIAHVSICFSFSFSSPYQLHRGCSHLQHVSTPRGIYPVPDHCSISDNINLNQFLSHPKHYSKCHPDTKIDVIIYYHELVSLVIIKEHTEDFCESHAQCITN